MYHARMEFENTVRELAQAMRLVGEGGELKPLDSITIVDFVIRLEKATQIKIPTVFLKMDNFESIAAVASMLSRLAKH